MRDDSIIYTSKMLVSFSNLRCYFLIEDDVVFKLSATILFSNQAMKLFLDVIFKLHILFCYL